MVNDGAFAIRVATLLYRSLFSALVLDVHADRIKKKAASVGVTQRQRVAIGVLEWAIVIVCPRRNFRFPRENSLLPLGRGVPFL
jgi:hypothetical protein